jgi:hypothetical protein
MGQSVHLDPSSETFRSFGAVHRIDSQCYKHRAPNGAEERAEQLTEIFPALVAANDALQR